LVVSPLDLGFGAWPEFVPGYHTLGGGNADESLFLFHFQNRKASAVLFWRRFR
jgi:hypothetical protein